jgi:hypothetical protein
MAIESLKKYLQYPNIHVHICDDGSGEADDGTGRKHIDVLAEAFGDHFGSVSYHEMPTPPGQFNTGGNINRGISEARASGCPIHMLNFDDWALMRELDLRWHVDVLETYSEVGFIRLSYLVPGLASIVTSYKSHRMNQSVMYLRFIREWSYWNPWRVETFLVSIQPCLAHVRFFDAYEPYRENVDPGTVEETMVIQYNWSTLKENGPQILHPIGPEITHAPWAHLAGRAHHYAEQFGP